MKVPTTSQNVKLPLILPQRKLRNSFSDDENGWRTGDLEIKPVNPMRKWTLRYQGPMVLQGTGTKVDVNLDVRCVKA